jgi:hypothetical protein
VVGRLDAQTREKLEILGRDWPAVMDRACRECPKPDENEACVECIVETAVAMAIEILEERS